MNVLIPVGIGSNWNNNEIKYFLRSLEINFKEDFKVSLYSNDYLEGIDKSIINKIDRYYPEELLKKNSGKKPYENFFDVLNKVRLYVNSHEGKFIYAYDDDILIKEITSNDIKNEPLEPEKNHYYKIRQTQQKHLLTINKSIDLFKSLNKPNKYIFIYETHLPRIYDCSNLRWIFNNFKLEELDMPFALATLYFNIFKNESNNIPLSKTNEIQARFSFEDGVGCFDSNTTEAIECAVNGKTWINYNDKALFSRDGNGDYPLQKWIKNKFKNKSKYEL